MRKLMSGVAGVLGLLVCFATEHVLGQGIELEKDVMLQAKFGWSTFHNSEDSAEPIMDNLDLKQVTIVSHLCLAGLSHEERDEVMSLRTQFPGLRIEYVHRPFETTVFAELRYAPDADRFAAKQDESGSISIGTQGAIPIVYAGGLRLPSPFEPKDPEEAKEQQETAPPRTNSTRLVAKVRGVMGNVLLVGDAELVDGKLSTSMDGARVANETEQELIVWRGWEQIRIPPGLSYVVENNACLRVFADTGAGTPTTVDYYVSPAVRASNRKFAATAALIGGVCLVIVIFCCVRRFSRRSFVLLICTVLIAAALGYGIGYHSGGNMLTKRQITKELGAPVVLDDS